MSRHAVVGSSTPSQKELARDREGASKSAWCASYWRGECPAGGGGGGSQSSQISLQATRNVRKQLCFFYLYVLNKIYYQAVF
jgi:hypothetical protein